jgi:hypothetical protein
LRHLFARRWRGTWGMVVLEAKIRTRPLPTSAQPDPLSTGRLQAVRTSIAASAKAAGRGADDVSLIAVSKTFAAEDIRPVLDAGQRVFGENRVQEAQQKWPELRAEFPDIDLHLIGPLQSNKARDAVALFILSTGRRLPRLWPQKSKSRGGGRSFSFKSIRVRKRKRLGLRRGRPHNLLRCVGTR